MSASAVLDVRPVVRPVAPAAVPPLVLRTHTGEALVLDRAAGTPPPPPRSGPC